MTSSRVALLADDLRLASTIQTHLQRAFGRAIQHHGLDEARARVTRDSDGLLLLLASTPVESERVLMLVQEIYLQKLPAVLVLCNPWLLVLRFICLAPPSAHKMDSAAARAATKGIDSSKAPRGEHGDERQGSAGLAGRPP